MNIKRRDIFHGAAAVGVATTVTACSDQNHCQNCACSDKHGSPRIPAELNTHTRHRIRAQELELTKLPAGTIRQANENNFSILSGQNASIVFIELAPGAIREPHWHPSAWEINIVLSGEAHWTVLEPGGYTETFSAHTGDVVFAPQGSMHYFRNSSTEHPLKTVVIFNVSTHEADNDISVAHSISVLPPEILAAVFKVPISTFANLPHLDHSVAIVPAQ